MTTAAPPVVIRTMMGAGNLELSLKCLGSIRKFCRHEIVFHVHEDGTLEAPLRARLREALGTVTFQDRTEANALMEEKLRAHPHCRAFRHRHIMAMQVLDIPMLAPATGRVVYTDTDILYTRPLECPDFFLGGGLPFTGSQDIRESYAVHLKAWPLLKKHGVQLASRSCGGMMSFEPAVHDLDYLEWLFRLNEEHGIFGGYPFFVPQTLFAALAARVERGWVEPRECVLAHPSNIHWARRASIIHFAGYSRNYFQEVYDETSGTPADGEPRRLGIAPMPICGLGRRLLSAARVRLFQKEPAAGVR